MLSSLDRVDENLYGWINKESVRDADEVTLISFEVGEVVRYGSAGARRSLGLDFAGKKCHRPIVLSIDLHIVSILNQGERRRRCYTTILSICSKLFFVKRHPILNRTFLFLEQVKQHYGVRSTTSIVVTGLVDDKGENAFITWSQFFISICCVPIPSTMTSSLVLQPRLLPAGLEKNVKLQAALIPSYHIIESSSKGSLFIILLHSFPDGAKLCQSSQL